MGRNASPFNVGDVMTKDDQSKLLERAEIAVQGKPISKQQHAALNAAHAELRETGTLGRFTVNKINGIIQAAMGEMA